MARDYARPVQPRKRPARNQRRPQQTPPPSWAVFAGGVATGLAVALTGFLWWTGADEAAPAGAPEPPPASREQAAGEARPRFDFYTLLKESEVFVPEGEAPEIAATPAPAAEPEPAPGEPRAAAQPEYQFILQAGSFRSRADADSLRARLLLLNLAATVESAGTRPGEVWHRVMVGPFTSPETLARARAALHQNGIDNILVKRKRP
jgi:cell division protein FtsN